MNDELFTKDSMFKEFDEVVDFIRKADLKTDKNLPAMVILEKQLDGLNKHGIIGRPQEIIALFEWGISQYAEQNDISFEAIISAIEEHHKNAKHIVIQREEHEV